MPGVVRPAEPAVELEQAAPAEYSQESTDFNITPEVLAEDDVLMEVPAAPPESLAYIEHHEAPQFRVRTPNLLAQSINSRQMAVPVLLTIGIMFCVGGVTRLIVGEDTRLYDTPAWVAPALFALGAVFLAVGLVNILQLKKMLDKQKEAKLATA